MFLRTQYKRLRDKFIYERRRRIISKATSCLNTHGLRKSEWPLYDKLEYLDQFKSSSNRTNARYFTRAKNKNVDESVGFTNCDTLQEEEEVIQLNDGFDGQNKMISENGDESTIFGTYVGTCLNSISEINADEAIEEINAVLYKYKKLSRSCCK